MVLLLLANPGWLTPVDGGTLGGEGDISPPFPFYSAWLTPVWMGNTTYPLHCAVKRSPAEKWVRQSHQEGGRGEIATVLGGYKEPIWGSSVAILAGFNFYGVCNSLEGGNENHWNLRNAFKGTFCEPRRISSLEHERISKWQLHCCCRWHNISVFNMV